MLLEITGFSKRFGGLVAVSNVDLSLEAGEIRGIIGPNGSGKSTLFNLISGVYTPEPGGTMFFAGEDVTNLLPHEIANRGVARTFQMLRIFSQMTVLENLLVGHHCHTHYGTASAIVGRPAVWREERRVRAEMMDLLSFIGLADYAPMPAGELSGGQRRLLALGRAMAMRPKLLMLDEPSLGLAPILVETIFELLERLRAEGTTILLVEQNVHRALEIADRAYVLSSGRVESHGPAAELRASAEIERAYLGIGVSE